MIDLRKDIRPSEATLKKLKEFQDIIDNLQPFAAKSAKAKDMFPKKNTKKNVTTQV